MYAQTGRPKGRQWVLKNISQIYTDKIVADTIEDRQQAPRAEACDYIHHWHLNRYGLRNLAEMNLLDLVASVRIHKKTSAKIRMFGIFSKVVDNEDTHNELDALSFYLMCLQHLSHPFGVAALFPESSEDGACSIKHSQVKNKPLYEATAQYFAPSIHCHMFAK